MHPFGVPPVSNGYGRNVLLRHKAFLLAAGAVIGMVAAVLVARSQFIDLQVYRFGAQALWRGDDLYGPLPPTSAGVTLPFIYPPFAAIALTPLVTAPWWCAAVAMFALSVAALGLALVVTVRVALPHRRAVAVGLGLVPVALLFEPVRATLGFGQVNLVLMGMVLADGLLPTTRWPRGTLVGLAAAVKITPAAFVLFSCCAGISGRRGPPRCPLRWPAPPGSRSRRRRRRTTGWSS